MALDTVFDGQMRPVFVDEPAVVRRRLKASYPESWTGGVLIGETQQLVTVSKYLYQEKLDGSISLLKDLLRKQSLRMYREDPSRLEKHIERTARRILDMGSKEEK